MIGGDCGASPAMIDDAIAGLLCRGFENDGKYATVGVELVMFCACDDVLHYDTS